MAKVLLAGQAHEGVGIAGEEHVVLCRTPVLQEGVQALNGTFLSLRGHDGAGDIDGAVTESTVREIADALKELIGQDCRAAAVQSGFG